MRGVVVLVVAAAACNGALGLDPVASEPADIDDDGVAYDNCRAAANPGQEDTDGDGLGDACDPCVEAEQLFTDSDRDGVDDGCDPCLLGRQHDEDADGVFDACDNCPIVADASQKDDDGDGVGDACEVPDVEDPATEQLFFDAFAPPDPRWLTAADPWIAEQDGFTPRATSGPLRSPDLSAIDSSYWYIDVGAEQLESAMKVALQLDVSATGESLLCELTCVTQCTLIASVGAGTAATQQIAAPGATLRLRMSGTRIPMMLNDTGVACEIVEVPGSRMELSHSSNSYVGFSLSAHGVRVRHVYAQR